jgi:pimeloyl-ACP methyl ester carboxylesterase
LTGAATGAQTGRATRRPATRGPLSATRHPERIAGLVLISSDLQLTAEPAEEEGPYDFDEEPAATPAGWAKWNRRYWLRDWPGFLEFFFAQVFSEPHSTKQIEDAIGWGLQTDPQTILRAMETEWPKERDTALRLCAQVRCPTLLIQGSQDAVVGPERGAAVATAIPGARLVTLEGSGHGLHLRDPVRTNLILRDFACPLPPGCVTAPSSSATLAISSRTPSARACR